MMDNFVPGYTNWHGNGIHGTILAQICMPGQGFDDNWKKCLINVAEVMAVYGLIWLIIGISAT